MSTAVKCPPWCAVDEHDPDTVAQGWAWHHSRPVSWKSRDGLELSVELACSSGLDRVPGDADVRPYVALSGTTPTGEVMRAEVDVDDVGHLIVVLRDLAGLEQRTRARRSR